MKKFLSVFILLSMLLSISVSAVTELDYNMANKSEVTGLSNTLSNAITVDLLTDSVMYSKNADAQIPLSGNIVRLMVALTVESEKRNGNYSDADFNDDDYEKLMAGMLVQERDDDARKLVLKFSKDINEFLTKMNTMAVKLGMSGTRFNNITGQRDKLSFTTVKDLALMIKEFYANTGLYSYLRTNMYTSLDGQMTFERKTPYNILNKDSNSFNDRIAMLASSAFENTGTIICTVSKDTSSREVIGIMYESGSVAAEYMSHYPGDIYTLQKNAYLSYYQVDLFKTAKSITKNTVFTLADKTQVYVALEIPDGEKTLKLFPSEYGVLIADENDCYIEVNEAQLPATAELGKIIAPGKLKYGNDVLLDVNLRATKIKMADGSIRSEVYSLYSVEEGAEQAERQYKKNDWILAVGMVCGIAFAAVVAAEIARRKMI